MNLETKQTHGKKGQGTRIVILGGGYAGMTVALRLARQSKAEIHLVNPRARFVERIRLHEAASGSNLQTVEIPHLMRGKGIVFHRALATQLDWQARTVTLNNGTQLAYDRLVYALGSQIDFGTPGAREHALALTGLEESEQVPARLAALPAGQEVVVVGGGLTGTELVTELAERFPHLRWMLVTRDAFERGYAPAAREHFLKVFARLGITLRTGIDVQRVDADHLVTNEGDLPFALCLWAGSFRSMALGRESGLAVNARDQVLVDASLRSLTAPEIYVAGDSASLPAAYAPFLVMGCKTAMPLGAHVAQNLLDEMRGATPAPLNFAYSATCISLGRQDGLVQFLQPNGEPTKIFLTGRLGAWVKEMICRFTVTVLRFERHVNAYDWVAAKPPRQKAVAPVASAVQSPSV